MTTPPPPPAIPAHEVDMLASQAMLILVLLLSATFLISFGLQRWRIRVVHESVVAIFFGMMAGIAIRRSDSDTIQKMVSFDHKYFFNVLLPPIILHSGYDLKPNHFFQNLGSVLAFAFVGTLMSTLVIGVLLALVAWSGLHGLRLSFIDCLMFGAILSSTDPVTVLAIFNQLQVDPKLYAIIFGESMLNDAVAIVLYRVLARFEVADESTFKMIFYGFASFLGVFMGSCLIGVCTALLMALFLRFTDLHRFPATESCLITLLAYTTYLLSSAIDMSGIVSLLFCGMTMKHYVYPNLSRKSRKITRYLFHVMAHLSENFIFIYLGLTIFTSTDEAFRWALIFFTFIFILVGRAASVFPLAWVINAGIIGRRRGWAAARGYLFRRRKFQTQHQPLSPGSDAAHSDANSDAEDFGQHALDQLIPRNHQIMLWWSGLRGAIAFALSMDIKNPSAREVRTTTLMVVVFSILLLGGSTSWALGRFRVRTGVSDSSGGGDRDDSDCSDSGNVGDGDDIGGTQRYHGLDETSRTRANGETPQHHWFMSFDSKYLMPIFARNKTDISLLDFAGDRGRSHPQSGNGAPSNQLRSRRPSPIRPATTIYSMDDYDNDLDSQTANAPNVASGLNDKLSSSRDRASSNSSDLGVHHQSNRVDSVSLRSGRDQSHSQRRPWSLSISTVDVDSADPQFPIHRIPPPPPTAASSTSSVGSIRSVPQTPAEFGTFMPPIADDATDGRRKSSAAEDSFKISVMPGADSNT